MYFHNSMYIRRKLSRAYGDRAFSVYANQVWNALPVSLRMISVFTTFNVSLKTYLFRKFFS